MSLRITFRWALRLWWCLGWSHPPRQLMAHGTARGGFPGFPCYVQLSTTPSSLNTWVEQSSPCVRHGTLTLRSRISPPSHHIFHHSHKWPGVSDSVNNISCLTAKLSGRIGHASASWLCLVLVYSEYGLHGAFHKYCQMLFVSCELQASSSRKSQILLDWCLYPGSQQPKGIHSLAFDWGQAIQYSS